METKSDIVNNSNPQECFVIMPITDSDGYEKGHFQRVYSDIFVPAIEKAGFKPIRADDDKRTNLIQIEILQKLIDSSMVLCDLSGRNPNVLFELGIRQAFDKPVVLVQEFETPQIFDISSIRYVEYHKTRIYHEVIEDQKVISQAIIDTVKACENNSIVNSIIRLLDSIEVARFNEYKAIPAYFILHEIESIRFDMQRLKGESIEDYLKKIDQEKEGLTYYTNSVEVMIQNKRRSFELPKFLRAEIDRFRRIAKYDSYGEYMKIADSYEDLLNKVEAYLESFKR